MLGYHDNLLISEAAVWCSGPEHGCWNQLPVAEFVLLLPSCVASDRAPTLSVSAPSSVMWTSFLGRVCEPIVGYMENAWHVEGAVCICYYNLCKALIP